MSEPMVCGGVYEYDDGRGNVRYGTMLSVTRDANNRYVGPIHFHGYAPEVVQEGSERLEKLKLVGRPASPKVGRPRKG